MPEGRPAVQRIARGALQTLGSVYCARLINWTAGILLMRRLAEEDFGHLAVAISLLTLVTSLRSFGLHLALLHQYDRVDRLAPTHFLLNTGLGALSTLAAGALALLFVPGWYGRIAALGLAVFAAADFLKNAASTSETQLRHDLRFGRLALAHTGGTVGASVIALAAAFAGAGVWSLVLGFYVQSVSYVLLYCALVWSARPPLRLARLSEFDRDGARRLFRYGVWFWVSVIMQALLLQVDRLVVASLLSARAVGFYSQAHMFAQIPTGAVTHTVVSVTGTVYARYQDDPARLSASFRRVLRLIVRATVPIILVLAVEAPVLVPLLVGERWLPMVPLLRWLVVYSLCRPVLDDVRALLAGVGRPRSIAGFAVVQAGLLVVLAPLLTGRLGTVGTALSVDFAALVGTVLAARAAAGWVDIPWGRALLPPLLAGAAAVGTRAAAAGFVGSLSALPSLLLGGVLLCGVYGLVLLLLEGREILEEARGLWAALTGTGQPL